MKAYHLRRMCQMIHITKAITGHYIAFLLICFILSLPMTGFTQDKILDEPQFFLLLQDVPLMHGLEEIEDSAVYFDKPEGRIIESVARMHNATEDQVLDFYADILPQFGWGPVAERRFFRKNEYLEIHFEKKNGRRVLKMMIRPTL